MVMETVVAAIIKDGPLVLLSKRDNPNHPSEDGKWEFPGGKVRKGEQLREALKREIWEELDREIEVERLVHTQMNSYPHGEFLVFYYLCRLVREGTFEKKTSLVCWTPLPLVSALDSLPGTTEALAKLTQIE